jgi:hypothetical protein
MVSSRKLNIADLIENAIEVKAVGEDPTGLAKTVTLAAREWSPAAVARPRHQYLNRLKERP